MQIKFNTINDNNLFLLRKFIHLNKSNYFRYYSNKPFIDTITQSPIKNHILTIVLTLEKSGENGSQSFQEINTNQIETPSIIGYAHLDRDLDRNSSEDEYKIWFGIYVLEDFQSKGYGKKIINYIFEYCKLNKIHKIYLSVDKDNEKALILYKKNNFIIESEGLRNFIMYKTF
jgi:ribosomal protein S18 acetylase RimI-like enzyme